VPPISSDMVRKMMVRDWFSLSAGGVAGDEVVVMAHHSGSPDVRGRAGTSWTTKDNQPPVLPT